MQDIKFETLKKIADTRFKYKNFEDISKISTISPPSVFIGSHLKYPLVNIGILSPIEKDKNAWLYDNEKYWAEKNFNIKEVLQLRNNLLNTRFKSDVHSSRINKKFVEIVKDIAISVKPVDIEIELKNRLRFKKEKDKILTPHGMKANLKKAKIVSNIKIPKKLDRVINDEIKTSESIEYLYKNNFNEYSLNKILSVGVLGLKKNKKIVPTKWSITATDDILGKAILRQVKKNRWIEDYELFYGEFLGNQYLILLIPNIWSYELFEVYLPKSSWNPSEVIKASTDYENYSGRKKYAFATAGGYYATRLPILEYLNKIKKQASVIVIRIETPSYWAALGVWVVRESVRKSLKQNIKFLSKKELLENTKKIGKIKFNFDISNLLKKSKVLKEQKEQKNLSEWF